MKQSVSVDSQTMAFITAYQARHGHKSRSAVVEEALRLLVERELEAAYAASSAQDIMLAREAQATYADGLEGGPKHEPGTGDKSPARS